jgi:hypothetical protein
MDEREFRRMLERYPVVRTRNHARVEWNSLVSTHVSCCRCVKG